MNNDDSVISVLRSVESANAVTTVNPSCKDFKEFFARNHKYSSRKGNKDTATSFR